MQNHFQWGVHCTRGEGGRHTLVRRAYEGGGVVEKGENFAYVLVEWSLTQHDQIQANISTKLTSIL